MNAIVSSRVREWNWTVVAAMVLTGMLVGCGGSKSVAPPPAPPAPPKVETPVAKKPGTQETKATPADAAPSGAVKILSDFNSFERVNTIGGGFGGWNSTEPQPEAVVEEKIEDGVGPDGSPAWKISYDISTPGSFCGSWMKLNDFDARSYSYLAFDIKGEGTYPTRVKCELKNENNANVGRTMITGISDQWQRKRIPLAKFKRALGNLNHLSEWVLVMDEAAVGKVKAGTILVDNVAFE